MNIIEALNSGRKFKRRKWTVWHDLSLRLPNLEGPDILADDWEILEEKRELTWVEIKKAVSPFITNYRGDSGSVYAELYRIDDDVKKSLGFTE